MLILITGQNGVTIKYTSEQLRQEAVRLVKGKGRFSGFHVAVNENAPSSVRLNAGYTDKAGMMATASMAL